MSADLSLVVEHPGTGFGATLALVVLKLGVTYTVSRAWGLEPAGARSLAVSLARAGELGLVVFAAASDQGLLAQSTADTLVITVTLSMALSPLIALNNDRWLSPRRDPDTKRPLEVPEDEAPNVVIADSCASDAEQHLLEPGQEPSQ